MIEIWGTIESESFTMSKAVCDAAQLAEKTYTCARGAKAPPNNQLVGKRVNKIQKDIHGYHCARFGFEGRNRSRKTPRGTSGWYPSPLLSKHPISGLFWTFTRGAKGLFKLRSVTHIVGVFRGRSGEALAMLGRLFGYGLLSKCLKMMDFLPRAASLRWTERVDRVVLNYKIIITRGQHTC